MRLVLNIKKTKWIMSDYELMKTLNDLCQEIRSLRHEVMLLKGDRSTEALKSKYLTMKEACTMLKVSRATMTRRLHEGDFSFAVKKGKSWLFPAERLKEYASGL